MGQLTRRLTNAWRRSPFSRRPRYVDLLALPKRSELPDTLDPHTVYVIGEPPKWAVLTCPCGHGHTIDLNLANPRLARWKIDPTPPPAVFPSIDVRDPRRRCHFWLSDGQVRWTPKWLSERIRGSCPAG